MDTNRGPVFKLWRNDNFIVTAVFILLTTGSFTGHYIKTGEPVYQFHPRVFPARAMDWLEANPQQGRMFNELIWGGYIL